MLRHSAAAVMGTAATLLSAAAPVAAQTTAYDCVIEPALTVSVAAAERGLLVDVPVSRGDTVRQGEVVGRLDTAVEETSIALLRERAESDAEIAAQAARLSLAESQRDRARALVERNVGAAGDLEEAEAAVEVALRELAMAELRARMAVLELERAEQALDRRTIRSPTDGIIVETLLAAGEYAEQNSPVVTIARIDPLHVEVFLPIEVYGSLAVGDTVAVQPAAPIGGEHEGRVTVVDQVFDAASGTFGLRIELSNPDLEMPAGLRCTVRF